MSLMSDIGAAIKLKFDKNASAMSKAQFNALAEERKDNRAGSGFEEWGLMSSNYSNINEGMWCSDASGLYLGMSNTTNSKGVSKTISPVLNINGVKHTLKNINNSNAANIINFPTAPTIYPHDTVLTTEQINSGVIKHADSSNSGLIVNGKFDTDTSGWVNSSTGTGTFTYSSGKVSISGVNSTNRGAFSQSIQLVVGKTYILECDIINLIGGISIGGTFVGDGGITAVNGRNTFTFTATSTTQAIYFYTQSSSGSCDIDNIAVYPADAISRSDLVFLESWHEDISEKNFVCPLGNTQYLGGNKYGLTGITNGNFTGFETYSLFGNWQTPSGLIGKGYIWSNLTEAQKRAFIANPENNCYLDGDKTIQVRYRVRVVQGLGDSWGNVDTQLNGSYTNLNYASSFSISPKGKLVNTNDYANNDSYRYWGAVGVLDTLVVSDNKNIGVFASRDSAINTFSYEKNAYALPIALIHRRNQGMYHNVYNPNGTKLASDGLDCFRTTVSFTSISDCFDPAKLLTASGYIGSVSGRPDGLFYDQVHESDITDLRNSSKKVEDYNRLISREFNKLVAGTTRGKEGEWINILNGTFTATASSSSIFYFTTIQPSWWTTSASGTVVYDDNIEAHVIFAGNGYRTKSRLYASGSGYGLILGVPITVGQSATIVISIKSTRTKSNTLLHCDIIGNPANYPTSWKESGVFGTPLIVGEDGTSLLPDGTQKTIKLSRKVNGSLLLSLKSSDGGVTWVSGLSTNFNSANNTITRSFETNALEMYFYQTHTRMAVPVANSEVVEYGKVLGTNGLANAHLVSTLIGKVATANTAPYLQMGYDINGYRIDTSTIKWSTTSTEIPVHSALSLGSGASGVATVKVLPYLTRLNGKAYLNLVFKEMKHNGTSWGDDSKFNIVDNVSTTTDNNAQTVLIGQKTVELNVFIGADE